MAVLQTPVADPLIGRSSLKRALDHPDRVESSAPVEKMRRRAANATFSLMNLPAEIRLQILRELLWQQTPLHVLSEWLNDEVKLEMSNDAPIARPAKTNYSLHPAILQVCKQLYREGEPMLYQNTILVTIDQDATIMGRKLNMWDNQPRLPAFLTSRISSLHLAISSCFPCAFSSTKLRRCVRETVQTLINCPQWSRLTISYETTLPDAGALSFAEVLRPFSLLRGLQQVSFASALPPEHAAALRELMTGNTPVVNLPRMYNALFHYTHRMVGSWASGQHFSPWELLSQAEAAMARDDEEAFREVRKLLLRRVRELLVRAEQEIFAADPEQA